MKRINLLKTLFRYCILFGSVATIALSLNTITNPTSVKESLPDINSTINPDLCEEGIPVNGDKKTRLIPNPNHPECQKEV